MNLEANLDTQAEQRTLSAISFQPGVEAIDDGYALCDKQSLKLVYCNQVFKKWFDVHELHVAIELIIDTLKTDILLKRLAKRGSYTLAIEPEHRQLGLPELMEVLLSSSIKAMRNI